MAATASGRCNRCRRVSRFECTGKFRVNASRNLIDVWLLFRCLRCQTVVKVPIVERTSVLRIPRKDLEAYLDNDASTASRLEADIALLRKAGLRRPSDGPQRLT
jgi:hypothetical protein